MRKHKARVEAGAASRIVILRVNARLPEGIGASVEVVAGARAIVVPRVAVQPLTCAPRKVSAPAQEIVGKMVIAKVQAVVQVLVHHVHHQIIPRVIVQVRVPAQGVHGALLLICVILPGACPVVVPVEVVIRVRREAHGIVMIPVLAPTWEEHGVLLRMEGVHGVGVVAAVVALAGEAERVLLRILRRALPANAPM